MEKGSEEAKYGKIPTSLEDAVEIENDNGMLSVGHTTASLSDTESFLSHHKGTKSLLRPPSRAIQGHVYNVKDGKREGGLPPHPIIHIGGV